MKITLILFLFIGGAAELKSDTNQNLKHSIGQQSMLKGQPQGTQAVAKNQPAIALSTPNRSLAHWEPFDFLLSRNDPRAYVTRVERALQQNSSQSQNESGIIERKFDGFGNSAAQYEQLRARQAVQQNLSKLQARSHLAPLQPMPADPGYYHRLQDAASLSATAALGILPGTFDSQPAIDAGYYQRLQRAAYLSGSAAEGIIPGTFHEQR